MGATTLEFFKLLVDPNTGTLWPASHSSIGRGRTASASNILRRLATLNPAPKRGKGRSAMHVGMSTVFQNPGKRISDYEVYRNELRLADLAEPLGYESIWGVEHHFTDYTMCPDVLQFLSYMAGRTERAKLGSMVVVLPWHDPVRVAEEFVMLDNLSDGRVVVGVGRGLARVEYAGFRLDMNESRRRFNESAEMLVQALEEGYAEFDGELVHPAPRGNPPQPLPLLPGPHLRRRHLPRVQHHLGPSWRGRSHHPAEALERCAERAGLLSGHLPGSQRG